MHASCKANKVACLAQERVHHKRAMLSIATLVRRAQQMFEWSCAGISAILHWSKRWPAICRCVTSSLHSLSVVRLGRLAIRPSSGRVSGYNSKHIYPFI